MKSSVVDQFRDKAVTVIGAGREGTAVTRFLASRGARITLTDSRTAPDLADSLRDIEGLPVTLSLGTNRAEDVEAADFVFLSPGVPKWVPSIEAAYALDKPVWSETRLVFALAHDPIIGITGSSGKTTTTSLIGHFLKGAGRPAIVGGNIGKPLINHIEDLPAGTLIVLELSSFQLQLMDASPHVAVLTNLKPDHLDIHDSMDEYVEAKRNIVHFQTGADVAVLNAEDPIVATFAAGLSSRVLWFAVDRPIPGNGVEVAEGMILARLPKLPAATICPVDQVPLRGRHNLANACAAIAAVLTLGVTPEEIAAALPSFEPPPHRLQFVRELNGVRFFDDSIATSPTQAISALEAFTEPIVLIAGGRTKQLDVADFARLAANRCRAIVMVGESTEELRGALARSSGGRPQLVEAETLAAAVNEAARLAQSGDVVLLSPGYTSFDQFPDYIARGQAFSDAVSELKADVDDE